MNRRALAVLGAAATGLLAGGCGAGSGGGSGHRTITTPTLTRAASFASPALATRATDDLALALLKRLDAGGNAVFSPYSIQDALAMVDQGAAGATANQLDALLGGARSPAALGASERALAADLDEGIHAHCPSLNNADAVWVQSGLGLEHPFSAALSSDFGVAPQTVDFAANAGAATQSINHWVAGQTHQLIPTLFPGGSLEASTALVLVNAIYLQARWSDPFDPRNTMPASFSTAPGHQVQTPFMSTDTDPPTTFPYARGTGWVAVGLPYRHSSLQLLAVMPSLGTLAHFQSGLSGDGLNAIAAALKPVNLTLTMPKTSLSLDSDVVPQLRALGLTDAFGPDADFSHITTKEPLQISAVQHDAVLKLDEKGTVAAAATGVTITAGAVAAPAPIIVALNHPFLLFLRDTRTGAILFAGRVANPASG